MIEYQETDTTQEIILTQFEFNTEIERERELFRAHRCNLLFRKLIIRLLRPRY